MTAAPSPEASSPTASKREVRAERRARRRGIAAARDVAADAEALATRGLALVANRGLGPGATVTLYESWAGEPPTPALLDALRAHGIRVLLPITLPDLDLDWFDAADPERRPLGLDAVARTDLALVPGLAVDTGGTRMGQGGGCYDKAIPRLRPGTEVVVLLHPGEYGHAPLPREPHDALVDGVLTAEGYTAIRR
ncbi:5-formyltetrahydrofolate cyclo-ligase [Nostocoides japonicum]|uniref:5-formyltetrahydrofolate cyclo-ligase n=1 Tax=Nostocoides japonicum TaxID=99481 RepID=UPI001F17DEF2|nr:5-formyltetrahydrofolate cyclo-ligase [Tetrasphaera japonica]